MADNKITSSTLHGMLEDTETVDTSTEATAVGGDMQLTMFVLQGRFGQGMALIEHSLLDKETVARLSTVVDPKDNKIWLEVDTDTGTHVRMDALPLSVELASPVYIKIYDLCNVVHRLMSSAEKSIALWVCDKKLYVGAFYNEDIDGFELEIGLDECEPFDIVHVNDDDFNVRIAMDQMSFNTIIDSIYEFETVEIHRKNGRLSYRTGNEHCTIATAMQNAVAISGEGADKFDNDSDFSISMPAKIFKVLPLVNALDLDLSLNVLIDIDTAGKRLRISGAFATLIAECGDSKLETYSNTGLERLFSIKADSVAAAIGMYFDMNYLNPTGKAKIYGINSGLIGIEGLDDERIHVNLTVGDCVVEKEGFEMVLPLDVFTMMIRNSGCPQLVLQHSFETGRTMMTYGNGMFLRKCTYNA